MHVVLLNGPPRSGKDTIGGMLAKSLPASAWLFKFAEPIRVFMADNFGIDMDLVEKDVPHEALHGRTPREVAIAYSERFCKPLFGVDYFGKRALDNLNDFRYLSKNPIAVYTDSGFSHEAESLATLYPCLQIRLHRPGKAFQGDSRSWWEHPKIGSIEFHNTFASLQELEDAVRSDLVPEIIKWASR